MSGHGVPPELFQDEIARLSLLTGQPQRAAYGELALAGTDDSEDITLTDVEEAVAELAARRGESYADTFGAVRALAGGERTVEALAGAAVALARQPEAESWAVALTDVSAAERREYARRGLALPDGSYPVGNAAQLRAAAVLAASGHGDAAAARKLIMRRAAELGVPLRTLPGFGDAGTLRLTGEGTGDAELSAPWGHGGADEIAQRYPGLFSERGPELFRSGPQDSGRAVRPGERATARNRAHAPDEDNPVDARQPWRGGVVHPEVARYLAMAGTERPRGSVTVHRHPYRKR